MRIAEVAEEYGISADTLRYYERIGLLPRVRRNASGIRDYDEDDCMRISFIKCMRGANVSIEALIEYMQLFEQGDATLEARKQILIEQRDAARERLERVQLAARPRTPRCLEILDDPRGDAGHHRASRHIARHHGPGGDNRSAPYGHALGSMSNECVEPVLPNHRCLHVDLHLCLPAVREQRTT